MQFKNLTVTLFGAKILTGVGSKGNAWQALGGKIFPLSDDYGDMFFFEMSPSGQRLKKQVTEKPFAQGATVTAEINAAKEVVSMKIIEEGFGPAEIYVIKKGSKDTKTADTAPAKEPKKTETELDAD